MVGGQNDETRIKQDAKKQAKARQQLDNLRNEASSRKKTLVAGLEILEQRGCLNRDDWKQLFRDLSHLNFSSSTTDKLQSDLRWMNESTVAVKQQMGSIIAHRKQVIEKAREAIEESKLSSEKSHASWEAIAKRVFSSDELEMFRQDNRSRMQNSLGGWINDVDEAEKELRKWESIYQKMSEPATVMPATSILPMMTAGASVY